MLFVLIRTYFCYFAKPKKCTGSCCSKAARDARLLEMYCNKEEVTEQKDKEDAPVKENPNAYKKPRKPKQAKESIGDFALEASDKIEKRRKKKS